MPICEVSISIGDQPEQNDGAPISILPEGVLVPWSECLDFMRDRTRPPALSGFRDASRARVMAHHLLEIAHYGAPGYDAQQTAELRWPGETITQDEIDTVNKIRDRCIIARDRMIANGYDSNWGYMNFREQGIARMDLPFDLMIDLRASTIDMGVEPPRQQRTLKRKAWRLPYETLLSAPSVDDWRDASVHVPVARGEVPWVPTDFEDVDPLVERTVLPIETLPGRDAQGRTL